MQSVRVYGSHSQYGKEPRQNPYGEPIIVKNFPSDGDVVEVLLGEPPKISFEAHRRKTGTGECRIRYLLWQKDNNF